MITPFLSTPGLAHRCGANNRAGVLRPLALFALLSRPTTLIAMVDDRPTTLAAAGGNPLELSAGAFLSWYWTLFFVLVAMSLVLRVLRVLPGTRHSSVAPSSRIQQDAYAVAYLAGGHGRVIETALASLVDHGALRVNAVTRDLITEQAPALDRPKIERRIWELIGSSRHVGDPARFRDEMRMRNQSSLALISDRLRHEGLLGKSSWRPKVAKLLTWGCVGLIGIGVVRMFAGMAKGRPVGFLVISLVITIVLGWLLLRRFDRERVTDKAVQLLADCKKTRLGRGGDNTVLWNVALLGIADQGIGPLADLEHVVREPSRGWGASIGNSFGTGQSSGSGGSGCSGGGGCGGGGCGGCGG